MQENDPIFVKVIIVGDSGVGKTSLLNRFCYSKFDLTVAPTIGTDFSTKVIKKQNNTLRLQLWDIAGQERFKAVSKMYIRGCLGCILVADATNEKTLKSLVEWKRIIVENLDYTGEDYRSPFIVLENKADLIKSSETEYSDVFKQKEMSLEEFVKENGINKGFLTSAKDNLNLDEAFSYLSDRILEQLEENPKKDKESNFDTVRNETLKYKLKNGKKEKKCC